MLPPYDTSATLAVVEALVERFAPDRVISLGDSFHDRKAETRMDGGDCERVRALTAMTDWIWVEGNHDPDPPEHLGGRRATCSCAIAPSATVRPSARCGFALTASRPPIFAICMTKGRVALFSA